MPCEAKGLSRPDGWNRLPSRDMRGRIAGAGLPAGESGWSRAVRGFENSDRSAWRCWRVDLLNEDERVGIVAKGLNGALGAEPEGVSFSLADSSVVSSVLFCPPSLLLLSNMLNSPPKLAL